MAVLDHWMAVDADDAVRVLIVFSLLTVGVQVSDAQQTTTPTGAITSESVIIAGFRLWHIIGLACCGVLIIIIIACCCTNCRIPRAKAEIEANYEKRKLNSKYEKELNRISMADFAVPKSEQSKQRRPTEGNTKSRAGHDNMAFDDSDIIAIETVAAQAAVPQQNQARF